MRIPTVHLTALLEESARDNPTASDHSGGDQQTAAEDKPFCDSNQRSYYKLTVPIHVVVPVLHGESQRSFFAKATRVLLPRDI